MSERNVEALKAILDRIEWELDPAETVARELAAHGVLAVDSLTDEEATTYPLDMVAGALAKSREERADLARAALRRLATGEPPPS